MTTDDTDPDGSRLLSDAKFDANALGYITANGPPEFKPIAKKLVTSPDHVSPSDLADRSDTPKTEEGAKAVAKALIQKYQEGTITSGENMVR